MSATLDPTSNVTSKGQVTVPVEIRRALGIKPGGKVRFRRNGDQILIEAVDDPPISSLFGLARVKKECGLPDIDQALESARGIGRAATGLKKRTR